jgi:hypothetical protein
MKTYIFIFKGVINRNPVDLILLYLSVDPVLYSSKICNVFQVLQCVHIKEIIPKIMNIIHVRHKIFASSLQRVFICKAYITFAVSFMLYFLLGISLLCEFVNDDSCDDVAQKDFEKSPVNYIWNKSTIIILLILSTYAFSNNFLSIKWAHASDYWIAVFVNSVNVDVNLLVLIKWSYVIV